MAEGVFTCKVAAVVVAELTTLVKTARYSLPLSPDTVEKLREVVVAPGTLLKVAPHPCSLAIEQSGLDCRWLPL